MKAKSALIVVDVQYDFLPRGSLAVPKGDEVLPHVNTLLGGKWDLVVASQDYHPPGHISFASTHKQEVFTKIDVPYAYTKEGLPQTISQVMWPDHCIQKSHGADIEESVLKSLQSWLDSNKGLIIQKGTDPFIETYSAFACSPGEHPSFTSLATTLRERGITNLFVIGLATDYCVRATALDARRAGFETAVIRDAVRAVGGEEATEKAEAEWKEVGVNVVNLEDPRVKQWL